jgi:hypothetical protein
MINIDPASSDDQQDASPRIQAKAIDRRLKEFCRFAAHPERRQFTRPATKSGPREGIVMARNLVNMTWSEALFVSELSAQGRPSREEATRAIRETMALRGVRGCAGELAQEYGEHPETAASRMRWAIDVVREAYPECTRHAVCSAQTGAAVHGGAS